MNYSIRAAQAIGRLKSASNDIEIYVEDTASRNMWLALIRAVIPHSRIKSVNQLGGRDRVINACKLDQRNDGRKKIYIIDGDFDYLLGKTKPRLKFLYRLRSYCVENLLVTEESACDVGMIYRPNDPEMKIRADFGFTTWINSITAPLKTLFVTYAIAHKLSPATPTTSFSVSKLFLNTPQGPTLCPHKVLERIKSVIRSVKNVATIDDYRIAKSEILGRMARLNLSQIASGKDYVLPIFIMRLQKILGVKGSNEQIKVQLSRSFVRKSEPWLCRRLEEIA